MQSIQPERPTLVGPGARQRQEKEAEKWGVACAKNGFLERKSDCFVFKEITSLTLYYVEWFGKGGTRQEVAGEGRNELGGACHRNKEKSREKTLCYVVRVCVSVYLVFSTRL